MRAARRRSAWGRATWRPSSTRAPTLGSAAAKIARSKTFDNATSCSSENSLVDPRRGVRRRCWRRWRARAACCSTRPRRRRCGAHVARGQARAGGRPRQSAPRIARARRASTRRAPAARRALPDGRGAGIGHAHPFSGEKLSPVLRGLPARDFDAAARDHAAHLCLPGRRPLGRRSTAATRRTPSRSGLSMPVARVIVNQAHCIATGGSFDNGLPFSLSMGCGTWGRNSFSDNMNYRHFLNITRIARPIPERVPAESEIFGAYHGHTAGMRRPRRSRPRVDEQAPRRGPRRPWLLAAGDGPQSSPSRGCGRRACGSPRSSRRGASRKARRVAHVDAQRPADRAALRRGDVRGAGGHAAQPARASLAARIRARPLRRAARRSWPPPSASGSRRRRRAPGAPSSWSPWIPTATGFVRRCRRSRARASRRRRAAGRDALMMYTSGTTGVPKGVVLTQGNVVAGRHVRLPRARLGAIRPGARGAAALPHQRADRDGCRPARARRQPRDAAPLLGGRVLAAGDAARAAPGSTSCRRSSRYLLDGPDPRDAGARDLGDPLLPLGLRAAAARAPPRLRANASASASSRRWGLTETAAPVFTNPLDPARRKIGSPGRAFGNEAKVVDPQSGSGAARRSAGGDPGARSERDEASTTRTPEATAKDLAPDGWLHTGDLGLRDADGFFFITGRLKELIIKGGENIAPREIDEALLPPSRGARGRGGGHSRPALRPGHPRRRGAEARHGGERSGPAGVLRSGTRPLQDAEDLPLHGRAAARGRRARSSA